MYIHLTGWTDTSKKKRCETCKHFILWGTSWGRCLKHQEDFSKNDHCKFHKRNSEFWTKDGKSKYDIANYYL